MTFPIPFGMICRLRKDKKETNTPAKILIFNFLDYQFQLSFPFNNQDKIIHGQDIKLRICPIRYQDNQFLSFKTVRLDFSDNELKKDDVANFYLKLTPHP